jgi:Pyruvate/2-oxoacid:ferredoxin oxidoreductase delta subunit
VPFSTLVVRYEDNAVQNVADGHGYRFDYDYCKGCGLCVQECPCGAIDMVPEQI